MKSLAPNTLLQNRYLVVHLIGKGGMGDVYLAVDQRLGSAVALKRTFFSDDEMLGNAFEREAKTLARLRHPVLTKVSDHFSENDVQFLVMEHIAGDDLAKRLEAAQKPFPLSWVLFWADQLLDALAYLHSHEPQIIHRDIKPQNLKLTDENSIILLDFGLSKNTAADVRGGVVTGSSGGSTASVVGYTPHYAPMEQIRGTGTNPKSDIYALSATLYQLLTNVVPFDALTRADSLLNGLEDPIKPIDEINPEVPPGVAAVILKGMELSQDRRFADAREMQKALRETFNQIQSSMAAQTVAFNLNDELAGQPVGLPDLPFPEKPSVLNAAPKTNQPPPSAGGYNSAAPPPQNSSPRQTPPPAVPNFDATLRMDEPPIDSYSKPPGNSPPPGDSYPNQAGEVYAKQSDVKTEVFLAGSSSAPLIPPADDDFAAFNKTPARENKFGESAGNQADAFSSADDYGDDAFAGIENKYAPNAVPLFSADNKTEYIPSPPADSEFFDSRKVQQEADAFSTYTPAKSYADNDFSDAKVSRGEVKRDEKFASPPPSAAKKSSGKTTMIVGGLFALLFLGIAAAVAGWLIYSNYSAAAIPTPTPTPTVEYSPTPAPTVEAVMETNTNTANNTNSPDSSNADNSNAEVTADNSNAETNSQTSSPTDRPTGTARTPQPNATPRAQTTVRTTPPPRVNPTPAVKPPVKTATPRKPDAPVILP